MIVSTIAVYNYLGNCCFHQPGHELFYRTKVYSDWLMLFCRHFRGIPGRKKFVENEQTLREKLAYKRCIQITNLIKLGFPFTCLSSTRKFHQRKGFSSANLFYRHVVSSNNNRPEVCCCVGMSNVHCCRDTLSDTLSGLPLENITKPKYL